MVDGLVWGLVLAPIVNRIADLAWDKIVSQLVVGTKVMKKDTSFFTLRGSLLKRASGLLDARNQSLKDLYTVYSNQDDKLTIGDHIRIAYAHQCHFIPGTKDFIDFASLHATAGDQYSVDDALNLLGFKNAGLNYRTALEQRKKVGKRRSDPFNGSTVRITNWDGRDAFVLSSSFYTDQYVTNQKEIIDTEYSEIAEHGEIDIQQMRWSQTLRRENTEDSRLKKFPICSLANTIGIAATCVTADGYLILPKRNRGVHFQSGYEGCSISGALEYKTSLFQDMGSELMHQLLTKEGPHELLLDPEKSKCLPLAFAREFERGGKPQFFFHVWSDETLARFQNKWEHSKYPQEEYDSIRWIQLFEPSLLSSPARAADVAAERIAALVASNTLITLGDEHDVVLSEEVRANLFYLMFFLQTQKGRAFPKAWK